MPAQGRLTPYDANRMSLTEKRDQEIFPLSIASAVARIFLRREL
jgi:hypothetical protein